MMLTIELKKGKDGPSSLACVRGDGTRTWARLHPFLPTHDLTHCAVESVLGFTEAFFGLLDQGWEIDTFAKPGMARQLPHQAIWAEHLVGLLEHRVADDAPGLNEALAVSLEPAQRPPAPLLTAETLTRIRALRNELVGLWASIAPGETLRVSFPASFAVA